jgi:hypothetical protein
VVAGGAVALDNLTGNNILVGDGSSTDLVFAHAVGASLTNSYLVVGVVVSTTGTQTVTSVTYGAQTMTQIGSVLPYNSANVGTIYLFGLKSPAAGTANVTIVLSAPLASTFSCLAGAMSFSHVNQTTPITLQTPTYGYTNNPSITITSSSNDMVVTIGGAGSALTAWAATDAWHNNYADNSGCGNVFQGYHAGAGAVVLSYTGGSDYWGIVGADLHHD